MNAIDKAATGQAATGRTARGAGEPTIRLRIRYLDPLELGAVAADANSAAPLETAFAKAAAEGFTAVMLPPPWQPGSDGDRFAPGDLHAIHPALGGGAATPWLQRTARLGADQGLQVLLDLPVAALAADFAGNAAPWAPPDQSDPLDPRHAATHQRRLVDPEAAGAWWGGHLAAWQAAGIAGVRVLGLAAAPNALTGLRKAASDALLIAWTPGLPREVASRLQDADYVVSSLPWWDGQAEWFWDELAWLQRVAPVLACPEAPFATRAAATVHDPAQLAATLRRAASLACALGDGWLVPAGFETGVRRPMDPAGAAAPASSAKPYVDLAALNTLLGQRDEAAGSVQLLSGPGAPPVVVLRTDAADSRFAAQASLSLVNTDPVRARVIDPAAVLPAIDGSFTPFTAANGTALAPGSKIRLAPGELLSFNASAQRLVPPATALDADAAARAAAGAARGDRSARTLRR